MRLASGEWSCACADGFTGDQCRAAESRDDEPVLSETSIIVIVVVAGVVLVVLLCVLCVVCRRNRKSDSKELSP